MTKIKLCGLRRPEDVTMVNRAMSDFAGFVFAKGRRQVTLEAARALRKQLDPKIRAVGVFVDEDGDYIRTLRWRTKAPIIKVIRVKNRASLADLDRWDCEYFLLDTFAGSQFGGGGKTFDHSLLRQVKFPRPFFLAGGLDPENVAEAIRECAPYGVDTSSGIETAGYKNEDKIRAFVRAVRKEEEP